MFLPLYRLVNLICSGTGWFEETMMLHVIDEFEFQQMIHKKEEFVPL